MILSLGWALNSYDICFILQTNRVGVVVVVCGFLGGGGGGFLWFFSFFVVFFNLEDKYDTDICTHVHLKGQWALRLCFN